MMETTMNAAAATTGRNPKNPCCAASEFAEMMRLAAELVGRGLPVGMARIVPHGLDAGAGAELERIAMKTSECFAWGCSGGVCGVLFRANLLYELMPVWRRFLARYPGLQVGVALSGVVRDAEELWTATRVALAEAHAQNRQMLVLEPLQTAERARGFGMLRPSGYAPSSTVHAPEEWGDLSLLGRGLVPVMAHLDAVTA